MARRWQRSRFDIDEAEHFDPMANLLDLMLVFACGLIAALIAMNGQLQQHFQTEQQTRSSTSLEIQSKKELPQLPEGMQGGEAGYEAVGQVFRDPQTGKLIMIGD